MQQNRFISTLIRRMQISMEAYLLGQHEYINSSKNYSFTINRPDTICIEICLLYLQQGKPEDCILKCSFTIFQKEL